jgi:hypothetical protein
MTVHVYYALTALFALVWVLKKPCLVKNLVATEVLILAAASLLETSASVSVKAAVAWAVIGSMLLLLIAAVSAPAWKSKVPEVVVAPPKEYDDSWFDNVSPLGATRHAAPIAQTSHLDERKAAQAAGLTDDPPSEPTTVQPPVDLPADCPTEKIPPAVDPARFDSVGAEAFEVARGFVR